MTYTIISASYANPEKTAAVLVTKEVGSVAISAADAPDDWAAMFVWGVPEDFPATSETETLLAYAAAKRWEVETGGIAVGGAPIRTDEKSQNRVAGAALLAISDPALTTIDWEAQPGIWIEVPAATMTAIGIAVGRHVQACFSTLKAVQAAIAAGTITTTTEIDAAVWPG